MAVRASERRSATHNLSSTLPTLLARYAVHALRTSRSTLHAQHEVGAVRESVTQPAEFTVPVERQQQIGVTYATIKKRSFTHAIRAVGIVAYDKQRHWDYVTR